MSNSAFPKSSCKVYRSEWLWLLGAVVFGAFVRLNFPGRMAIEHFDEGVYASNFWFGAEDGYSYPVRYLYAPPLLPAAIEWTMTIASLCGIKPTGFIPMIPCLIAGIAMIPSLWWVCRQWFGPTAGLVSAWLVSTSDFHVSYSRAALTDVPVCLFILWGVYFTGSALLKTSAMATAGPPQSKGKSKSSPKYPLLDIFLAGIFTGLAWWTKYNGWLPLAIGATAGVLWQLLTPRPERQIFRVGVCWLQIAVVAFLIWSPVLWGLQKHGGYATVAANHRQYVVGLTGWGRSAASQLYKIGYYEDPLDLLRRPFVRRPDGNDPGRKKLYYSATFHLPVYHELIRAGVWRSLFLRVREDIFNLCTPLFVPLASLLISIAVCGRQLFVGQTSSTRLFHCIMAGWFAGMTVATPFYHPYPRLVLPWLCASWICLAVAVETYLGSGARGRRIRETESDPAPAGAFAPSRGIRGLLLSLPVILILRFVCGSAVAWSDRCGIERASIQFAATVKKETRLAGFPENEAIVYVLGEPALVFGLRAEGLGYVGPVQGLEFANAPIRRPTFLAFTPGAVEWKDADRFQREDGMMIPRSHLVLLDEGEKISYDNIATENETRLWRLYR